MSKLSMRTRMYHSVNGRMCAGAHFLSRRNPDNVLLLGGIVITVNFGPFAEIQKQFLNGRGCPVRSSKLLCLAFFRCAPQLLFHVFHGAEGNDDVKCRVDDAVNLFFVIVFSPETRLVGEIHAVGVDCPT